MIVANKLGQGWPSFVSGWYESKAHKTSIDNVVIIMYKKQWQSLTRHQALYQQLL